MLDLDYKVEPDSDHVTKFRGDRPRDLRDWALNKKNITGRIYKPVPNGGSGGPNNLIVVTFRRITVSCLVPVGLYLLDDELTKPQKFKCAYLPAVHRYDC